MSVKYSFVIPVFNEQETLLELHRRLSVLINSLDGAAEVILVDDGSSDDSSDLLSAIYARDSRFKSIHFARNFGQQVAITAALDFVEGEAIIVMDADLQDPPEVVQEMIARWNEGYEVVYGRRRERHGETWFKKTTSFLFYRTLEKLSPVSCPKDTGEFRLIDRKVVEAFRTMPERTRYVRGMFSWLGFKQIAVEFDRPERLLGETKYTLGKMIKLAQDAILSFSYVPLQAILTTGAMLAAIGLLGTISQLGYSLVWGTSSSLAWMAVSGMTFFTGLQLIGLGILGEYVGRIYEEVKQRPLYVIRNLHGFPPSGQPQRHSLFGFSGSAKEALEKLEKINRTSTPL